MVCGVPPLRFETWEVRGEVRVGVFFPVVTFFRVLVNAGVVLGVASSSSVYAGEADSLVEATLGAASDGAGGGAATWDWRNLQQKRSK